MRVDGASAVESVAEPHAPNPLTRLTTVGFGWRGDTTVGFGLDKYIPAASGEVLVRISLGREGVAGRISAKACIVKRLPKDFPEQTWMAISAGMREEVARFDSQLGELLA